LVTKPSRNENRDTPARFNNASGNFDRDSRLAHANLVSDHHAIGGDA
jgi:hypothetical protein